MKSGSNHNSFDGHKWKFKMIKVWSISEKQKCNKELPLLSIQIWTFLQTPAEESEQMVRCLEGWTLVSHLTC